MASRSVYSKASACLGILLGLTWVSGAIPGQTEPVSSIYRQAESDVAKGNFGAAITLLERVLVQSPHDFAAQNLMGIALSRSGKLEEANTHFRAAISSNPKFYPALKNLALNEMAQKNFGEAQGHFDQVLKYAPQDSVAHLSLAEIHYANKEFKLAADHYLKCDGLFQRNPYSVMRFARSCFESNQAQKAAGALEQLEAGTDGRLHFQAGLMLAQLARYSAAARQFELARKDYPDPYEVGFNLTLAYVRGQNSPGAIRVANELISQGYRKAELYNLLSDAYERSGQTIEAYNALRTATQIDPLDENNYLDLMALGVDHGNFDLALDIGAPTIIKSVTDLASITPCGAEIEKGMAIFCFIK